MNARRRTAGVLAGLAGATLAVHAAALWWLADGDRAPWNGLITPALPHAVLVTRVADAAPTASTAPVPAAPLPADPAPPRPPAPDVTPPVAAPATPPALAPALEPAHAPAPEPEPQVPAPDSPPPSDATPAGTAPVDDAQTALGAPSTAWVAQDYRRLSELTRRPMLLTPITLDLPIPAGAARDGVLRLRLLISAEGAVEHVLVERADLDATVIDAAVARFAQARYQPGELDGTAVRSQVLIEVGVAGR